MILTTIPHHDALFHTEVTEPQYSNTQAPRLYPQGVKGLLPFSLWRKEA